MKPLLVLPLISFSIFLSGCQMKPSVNTAALEKTKTELEKKAILIKKEAELEEKVKLIAYEFCMKSHFDMLIASKQQKNRSFKGVWDTNKGLGYMFIKRCANTFELPNPLSF